MFTGGFFGSDNDYEQFRAFRILFAQRPRKEQVIPDEDLGTQISILHTLNVKGKLHRFYYNTRVSRVKKGLILYRDVANKQLKFKLTDYSIVNEIPRFQTEDRICDDDTLQLFLSDKNWVEKETDF